MIIDEALFAILAGSPPLAPGRWYAMEAFQGSAPPYGIFQQISSARLDTMDRQSDGRIWTFQLSFLDVDYLSAARARQAAADTLILVSQLPRGIQRILPTGQMTRFLDSQRLYQLTLDLDIMENLP